MTKAQQMSPELQQRKNTFGLTFQITKQCNFQCTYCYEIGQHKNENLSLEDLPEIISFCEKKAERDTVIFDLTFIGGEPTLNSEIAQSIQKELYDRGLLNSVTLITNGWSSNAVENFIVVPKEYVRVQISYDGSYITDKYRVMSGKSTKDKVLSTVKELLQKGYFVSLKSTLPIDALEYVPDILKEFDELSRKYQTAFLYNPTEDFTTTFNLTRQFKDYQKYFDKHFKKILEIEIDRLKRDLPPITVWFSKYSTELTPQCQAGISFVTINEKGDIQYCQHVDYTDKADSQLQYTNIRDPEALDKLKEVKYFNKQKIIEQKSECYGCTAMYCLKCPILNFSITKDKTKMHGKHAIPFMCEYYQNMTKFLYIYDTIKKNKDR